MMNSDESLLKNIQAWLQKQGYPLEMLVARSFQEAEAFVLQSQYYFDTETGKPREIDVSAKWYKMDDRFYNGFIECSIWFYVECKSGQKAPWIIFSNEKSNDPFFQPTFPPADKVGHSILSLLRGFEQ